MSGDDLAVELFLWGLVVAFGLAAVSMAESPRKMIVRLLWATTAAFLLAALLWPAISDAWPAIKNTAIQVATSAIAVDVLGLAVVSLLVLDFRLRSARAGAIARAEMIAPRELNSPTMRKIVDLERLKILIDELENGKASLKRETEGILEYLRNVESSAQSKRGEPWRQMPYTATVDRWTKQAAALQGALQAALGTKPDFSRAPRYEQNHATPVPGDESIASEEIKQEYRRWYDRCGNANRILRNASEDIEAKISTLKREIRG